jgi:two-component system OmpR family sensor kinase
LVVESVRTARTVAADFPVTLRIDDVVTLTGDQLRLRQIVDNLLANVRTHNPPGTTTSLRVRADGPEAVLTVADDGPGMTADDAAHVFERFYRADPSRSRLTGGSGLGLPIVAAVVAAHDGCVTLASRPGDGVTVTVRLPRILADSDDSDEPDEPDEPDRQACR